jgi:hypothetical protein
MTVRFATSLPRRSTSTTLAALALSVAVTACAHRSPAPAAAAPARRAAATPAPAKTPTTSMTASATSSSAGRLSRAALLRSAPAGTYILDVLSVQGFEVVRWPEHVQAPIRVWIADGSHLPGWRATFPGMVRSAFGEWTALGIPLRVVFVDDSASASLRVNWVDHFGQDVSGRTTWQYDDAGLIRAGRTTLSTRRADGTRRTEAQLRAIALHEAGHALGLQHAEDDETSIMAPRVDALGLSDADRATVRLLYARPAGKLQ